MKVVCICLVLAVTVFGAPQKGAIDYISSNKGEGGLIILDGFKSKGLACDKGGENIAKIACSGGAYKSVGKDQMPDGIEWSIELTCTGSEKSLNECGRAVQKGADKCDAYVGCA